MKSLLKNAFLVFVSVAIGALISEAALRVQEPFLHLVRNGPNAKLNDLLLSEQHPLWHHWPRPNFDFVYATLDAKRFPRPVSFHANAQGCRYPTDLEIPKPAGLKRILVLGDSFTEGYYFEDTVAARLETALRERNPSQKYEVVNCGFSSYSPLLHYIRLKNQFLAFQPDVILLNIDNTDIWDDYWGYRPLGQFAPDGEPISVHRPQELLRAIKEHGWRLSYLFRYLMLLTPAPPPATGPAAGAISAAAPQASADRGRFDYFYALPPQSREWQTEVAYCISNVERTVNLARSKGVPMVVTIYPHVQQLPAPDGRPPTWNREFEFALARMSERIGAPFFSAYDAIAEAYQRDPGIYWGFDMHFTPRGQRVWADTLVRYWLERGF